MASATVGSTSDRLQLESIPTVDLRILSQSELYALSLCSDDAFDPRRCDDVVIPKIDRSVFNESAGSRKQTYSRLRLAPRKPETAASSSIPRRTPHLRTPKSPPDIADDNDPERAENSRIIGLLKELFAADTNGDELIPVRVEYSDSVPELSNVANNNGKKRKRGRPRKNENAVAAAEVAVAVEVEAEGGDDVIKDIVVYGNVEDRDREILNKNGVVVDVAALANLEDPYGPELRRRTEGLETEEELLGFLRGLNGQWGSRRKKKKIVDASDFGDVLPKGWKLLLSLKKKEGRVWLFCRRYISPNGRQFVSCKEVSTYLISFFGFQDANQQNIGHSDENMQLTYKMTSGNIANLAVKEDNKRGDLVCYSPSPITYMSNDHEKQVTSKIGNPGEILGENLKCHKCAMTFDEKDDLLHHQLSCHRRKRSKFGTSITDGVIINGGKYVCQFCHKTFTERNRYNGHVGAHVKNHVKSVEASPGVLSMGNNVDPVSLVGIPPRESMMQTSTGDDSDAAAETFNAKADDELNSDSPYSKADSDIETYTDKFNQELNFLSHDKQDTMANRSEKTSVEESCDKQDRDYKMTDDNLGRLDEATVEVGSESRLLTPNGNKITCGTKNMEDRRFTSTMEEFKLDREKFANKEPISGFHSSCAGQDEDVVTEVKQQSSSDVCSFVPVRNEQKCGNDSNMNGFLTSIVAESGQTRGFESSVLTPSGDEEICDGKDNEKLIGFGSSCARKKEDAGIRVDQERSSESCSLFPSWKGLCDIEDNGNEASTCMMKESGPEKGSKSSLLILSGYAQTCGVENNADKVSTRKIEKPKLDEVQTSGNSELDFGSSSCSGLNADVVTSTKQERILEFCSLVPSGNQQTFGVKDNVTGVYDSTVEEPRLESGSESGLLTRSFIGQSCDDVYSVSKVSTSLMEEPKLDEVQNSSNTELFLAFGNTHIGPNADVMTGVGFEQTCGVETNLSRVSTVEEPQQERGSRSGLLGPSCNGKTCGLENNLNRVYTGRIWEGLRTDKVGNSGNEKLMIGFGSSDAQPDEDAMAGGIWRTDEENVLRSGLADNSATPVQSSNCFPTFDIISDKGENELFRVDEKYDSMPGFGGLRSGSTEHVEFNFLPMQNLNSLPVDSKVLSYDTEMGQGFDSSFWLEKDALSPNIAARSHVTTVCVWCRNEFHHEPVHPGTQTGAIGSMCPTCNAKISEQFNVL